MIITIDGPAGSGKTSVAQKIAKILQLPYFDTGAIYRGFTLWTILHKISLENQQAIEELLESFFFQIEVEKEKSRYLLSHIDVTEQIYSEEVTKRVSYVSLIPEVRERMNQVQKEWAKKNGGVFVGRDLGSVVFPNAEWKIFLTASLSIRANRRAMELQKKEETQKDDIIIGAVLNSIAERDQIDSSRKTAPLICPSDAYKVDTSDLSLEEVVSQILVYIGRKKSQF